MTVKTLYRYGTTVSPNKPEGEDYTTLLRVIADEGYILQLPSGTLTNCIDCETSEGITEVADTMGRQMELMGFNTRMNSVEEAVESAKTTNDARLEDIEQALIDIAAVQAEQDEIQAQQEDALIELAALTDGE